MFLPTVLLGRRGGGAAAWTPADLTGLAPSLSVALQRQTGLLWQNTAKTIAATADGDPVRVATCPWTGQDYTAPSDAARPLLWDEGGGKWSLSFDGVDDYLATSSASVGQCSVAMGCIRSAGANNGYWEISTSAGGLNQHSAIVIFGGFTYARRYDPQRDYFESPTNLPAGNWNTIQFDVTNSAGSLYLDGVLMGSNTDATITPVATHIAVGRWNGGMHHKGRMTDFFACSPLSTSDRSMLLLFMNGNHP